MWPLESAKTDSDWASTSRSSASSVTAHGSTEKCGWAITQQLGEVVDDDVGAVRAQRVALADAVDADDVAEAARAPGLHAGERVLEDRGLRRARRRGMRAASRNVSGAGLPRRWRSSATTPSTRTSSRSSIPAATSTSWQLWLEETTARRRPASRAACR